ncbi:MAG: acyl-CoA dehydrogenase [Bdellovibrionales bacterium]|nr:acyl-CoA dehydrogenase [Bdellovibrionales bacterium]
MEAWSEFSGFFLNDPTYWPAVIGTIVAFIATAYFGLPLIVWTVLGLVALAGFGAPFAVAAVFLAVCLVFLIPPIRRLVSLVVMKTMKSLKLIPQISQTERTALEAGVVWMEQELFSGHPNFKKMLDQPYHELSQAEQSFLDNEVETLCAMVDDYKFYRTREMDPQAWEFIRRKGFLGMIIPKEYGGLGFSHSMHSAVIQKISSRSIGTAIYVMVPNSLGPAELLVRYGTDSQKKKYLPRLASGEEVPCFGLTEPTAGSDAGSITSEGVLFKGQDGKVYMRLNWNKRWITLAAISSLIGLAFRLRDPENLLGKGEDLGITCALIPSNLKGVVIGKRHDPLGVPFHNCPTQGHDVVIEAEEAIIGGMGGVGQGWQMLMECLGAGRGISLPAQSAGGTKLCARICGNQAVIRKQFGVSIGKFEGVEEHLARIGGGAYMVEALRLYVLSALDQHISPPVVTAIAKFNATEIGRNVMNDAMDVMGGAGISMGPRNTLAITYTGMPIGITVEGANILTRTLMIFGQGALRAHPYAFKEVNAIERNDLKGFDDAFWGHIGHIVRNTVRSVVLSLTRAYFVWSPVGGPSRRYVQKLSWVSATFAILTDMAMGLLGGKLKVKEKLTGRFADVLSWMFIATAVIKRYEAEGRRKEDKIFLDFAMATAFQKIQDAFDGIMGNFDVPVLGWFFSGPLRWWSRFNFVGLAASDRLTHRVAEAIMYNEGQRDRLAKGMYMPTTPGEAIARLETAYQAIRKAEGVEKKVRAAVHARKLNKKSKTLWDDALKAGVITAQEQAMIGEAEKLRWDAIQVDEFTQEEYLTGILKNSGSSAATSAGASRAKSSVSH